MKYRTDYVTNSSSSSFIISKKHLDSDQIEAIRYHKRIAKGLGLEDADWDNWTIEENDRHIAGYTFIDNFDIGELLSAIEINSNHVQWGEYPFDLDTYRPCGGNCCDCYYGYDEELDGIDWRDLL